MALVAVSVVLAWARGLVRDSHPIVGWIVAAIADFALAPTAGPLMPEAPVLRDMIGTSWELGVLAGFAAVFAVALVVV